MARLSAGVSRRGAILLALLFAAFLAAPFVVNDYLLTVLILILYFAYAGQAWNIMMGFAGQLSLAMPSISVSAPMWRRRCLSASASVPGWVCSGPFGCRGLRGDHRISCFSLSRRRRLFRNSDHCLCRIRAYRLRSSGFRQCVGRIISSGQAERTKRSVAAAWRSPNVLLHHPVRDIAPLSPLPSSHSQPYWLLLARDPRG